MSGVPIYADSVLDQYSCSTVRKRRLGRDPPPGSIERSDRVRCCPRRRGFQSRGHSLYVVDRPRSCQYSSVIGGRRDDALPAEEEIRVRLTEGLLLDGPSAERDPVGDDPARNRIRDVCRTHSRSMVRKKRGKKKRKRRNKGKNVQLRLAVLPVSRNVDDLRHK